MRAPLQPPVQALLTHDSSEKQYKTTLKAWGLVKNVPKQAKESIVPELESREKEGKKTTSVKLGGAPVSEEKIRRWRKERARAAIQFDVGHSGAWCEGTLPITASLSRS